jgi:arachidonate 15-lipoxygenase
LALFSSNDPKKNRERYRYRECSENLLAPIAVAKKFPISAGYGPSWMARFVPGITRAGAAYAWNLGRIAAQKAAGRFDKLGAYRQLFGEELPEFALHANSDAAFAYRRVAGPNPLSLRQTPDLQALRRQIPFDVTRVEARLSRRLGRTVRLNEEVRRRQLFHVDFELIQTSLRPPGSRRDSRFREKYLPTPTAVFLEAPGFHEGTDLVPLAIQIDQPQPQNEYNPPFYPHEFDESASPSEEWGWRMAKVYFEVADVSFHVCCGHVAHTHLPMEAFSLATPRWLPKRHPVSILLKPHTRYTLPANKAAYGYFRDRTKTYFEFYAGTLDETRQIAIQSYQLVPFGGLSPPVELASRGVAHEPADYPYRDDVMEWLDPIHDFVNAYINAFYLDDTAVTADTALQGWFSELIHPEKGALIDPVPGSLDTRSKLVDLLSLALFTAGPGHASQHYSSNYYYRYAPAFAGAAHAPPLWSQLPNEAYYRIMLPPIGTAAKQFMYNTFGDFQYDVFGDYRGYRLGKIPEAAGPIQQLQRDLAEVERRISARAELRPFPYGFLLPSRVPNSVNI